MSPRGIVIALVAALIGFVAFAAWLILPLMATRSAGVGPQQRQQAQVSSEKREPQRREAQKREPAPREPSPRQQPGHEPAPGAAGNEVDAARVDLPPLSVPIRCTLGRDCVVQFYPDADTTDDIRDHRCGRTTYNRHRGTDIRVPSMEDVRRGIEVLAAAPGVVTAIRDGEPDIDVNERGRDEVVGQLKSGGNLVTLRHGPGWTSLYWHMRKDSVRVRQGQSVATGDVLGLVGLSGDTNFPHLHFELRLRNRHVDPFTGQEPRAGAGCGVAGRTLWSAEAAAALAWREITLVAAGFSDRQPNRRSMEEARPPVRVAADGQALAFWWELAGIETGDRTEIRVVGPAGRTFAERSRSYDRPHGFLFDFVGRKTREPWPTGTYTATVQHRRGERLLLDEQRRVEVK